MLLSKGRLGGQEDSDEFSASGSDRNASTLDTLFANLSEKLVSLISFMQK